MPGHTHSRKAISNLPFSHVSPDVMKELVQLRHQSLAGIGRLQCLAKPEMVGAVKGRQNAGGAVDFLKVGEIVPGSQVHTPVAMHPAVGLGSGQEDKGFGKGRLYLEDRAMLLQEVGKERRQVAVPGRLN